MKINSKQILSLSVIVIIAVNSYFKRTTHYISDNLRTTIDIILAVASIILFTFIIRQDKENAKKKIILASIYVLFTLLISFYFLAR
jgi:Ca2+/H+ antiporter